MAHPFEFPCRLPSRGSWSTPDFPYQQPLGFGWWWLPVAADAARCWLVAWMASESRRRAPSDSPPFGLPSRQSTFEWAQKTCHFLLRHSIDFAWAHAIRSRFVALAFGFAQCPPPWPHFHHGGIQDDAKCKFWNVFNNFYFLLQLLVVSFFGVDWVVKALCAFRREWGRGSLGSRLCQMNEFPTPFDSRGHWEKSSCPNMKTLGK